jgi:CBS domain containing-hemolysin-like protein
VDAEPPSTSARLTLREGRESGQPLAWLARVVSRPVDAVRDRVGQLVEDGAPGSLTSLESAVRDAMDRGVLDAPAALLLLRAAHFARRTAADAMVPRVRVVSIGAGASLIELQALAATGAHTRFLVLGEDPDDVLGVATLRDACRVGEAGLATTSVRAITSSALVVPETAPLPSVVRQLRGDRSGLALVVDEYGGTAGVLTMHDVLEQVAGEVDAQTDRVRALSPPRRGWLVPGGLRREALGEEIGLLLPEGSYDTVAGYLMEQMGRVPEPGEKVRAGTWVLEAHELDGVRIETVLAIPPASTRPEVPSPRGPHGKRTVTELAGIVRRARRRGAIGDGEARMLTSALRLVEMDARRAMQDRLRVVAVPHLASREEVEAVWLSSGYARLPVYEDSLDRIVGYVRAPELYRPGVRPWRGPIPRSLIHPVLRVRRSRRLVDVLEDMRRSGSSFGAVTGPRGVTLGILTLEDVLGQLLVGQDLPATP